VISVREIFLSAGLKPRVRLLIRAACIAIVALSCTQCTRHPQAAVWCWRQDKRAISLEMEISGCTTLIQSGNGTQNEIATAFYDRGVAYMEQGNHDQAMSDLDQAIRLRPNFPLAFYNVGVLYQARGEDDRSIQMFTMAISFKPDFAEAINNRAFAYNNKKEYDLAVRDADQAIRLRPDYAKAFVNRGVAELEKGDTDAAIQDGLRLRRRQYVPGGERVHVVPPVRDPPVFDLDDRAEPIVVLSACRKNLPVDLVFDNDAVAGLVCNQLIGGVKHYVVNIAAKLGHQGGSPADNSRPAGEVVEDLIDNIFGDDVEEVLPINEVA